MEDVSVLWTPSGLFPDVESSISCTGHHSFDRVELLLEGINKGHPSGSCPEFHRLIFIMSLLVTFPPIFDMGEGFKESEGDLFSVNFFLNRVIPF
jgi:hypothetical protein